MGHSIRLEQHVNAPLEQVWDRITDHCSMNRWLIPGAKIRLEPEGKTHPNGEGAVRIIEQAGMRIVEEIIRYEPNTMFAYTVRRGVPIRDHRGTIRLRDTGHGTTLEWVIEFRPSVVGTGSLIAFGIKLFIGRGLTRFAAQLESTNS